jgi:hypothetical protein
MAQERFEAFHHLLAGRQITRFIHPTSGPLVLDLVHQGQILVTFSVPLWGFMVLLLYRMRRVDCRACGARVEELPWAIGKHQLTKAYMLFLAHWARKRSWQETSMAFRSTRDKVRQAVEYVVEWGLEHRNLAPIQAIGVDEIQYVNTPALSHGEAARESRWCRDPGKAAPSRKGFGLVKPSSNSSASRSPDPIDAGQFGTGVGSVACLLICGALEGTMKPTHRTKFFRLPVVSQIGRGASVSVAAGARDCRLSGWWSNGNRCA